ncbi:MAG: cyclic nucleotide-binding domain-containing protein [Syntrophobacteraceae bacterium]
MEFQDRRDLLKNSIFGDLPPEEIDALAQTVAIKDFGPREVIFEAGDPPDGFYIVCSGRVRLFVRLENRRKRELLVYGPGEYFGEISLMTGGMRPAGAESIEKSTLIILDKQEFDRLRTNHPEFAQRFTDEVLRLLVGELGLIKKDADAAVNYSKVRWLDFVVLLGISILMAITFNNTNPNGIAFFPGRPAPVASVAAATVLNELAHDHPLIIDARPSNFYGQKHIKGAVNMPLAIFDFVYLMQFSNRPKNAPIVVYGNTISRLYAVEVADKLITLGYTNVKVLKGDMRAWQASNYPVEKGTT